MTYKNSDMKNFRAKHETLKQQVSAFIALIILLIVVAFFGDSASQVNVDQSHKIRCP